MTGKQVEDDDTIHVTLPRAMFATVLVSMLAAGAGTGFTFAPQMDSSALEQCFDNSQTALEVASERGKETAELVDDIAEVRRLIYNRTTDQYNASEAHKQWIRQESVDKLQNDRISYLERQTKN